MISFHFWLFIAQEGQLYSVYPSLFHSIMHSVYQVHWGSMYGWRTKSGYDSWITWVLSVMMMDCWWPTHKKGAVEDNASYGNANLWQHGSQQTKEALMLLIRDKTCNSEAAFPYVHAFAHLLVWLLIHYAWIYMVIWYRTAFHISGKTWACNNHHISGWPFNIHLIKLASVLEDPTEMESDEQFSWTRKSLQWLWGTLYKS